MNAKEIYKDCRKLGKVSEKYKTYFPVKTFSDYPPFMAHARKAGSKAY